jgi:hypothetical protein
MRPKLLPSGRLLSVYGEKSTCKTCKKPIKYSLVKGWLHVQPLSDFVVSEEELERIHQDPIPPGHQPIHRKTVLHQAMPA